MAVICIYELLVSIPLPSFGRSDPDVPQTLAVYPQSTYQRLNMDTTRLRTRPDSVTKVTFRQEKPKCPKGNIRHC